MRQKVPLLPRFFVLQQRRNRRSPSVASFKSKQPGSRTRDRPRNVGKLGRKLTASFCPLVLSTRSAAWSGSCRLNGPDHLMPNENHSKFPRNRLCPIRFRVTPRPMGRVVERWKSTGNGDQELLLCDGRNPDNLDAGTRPTLRDPVLPATLILQCIGRTITQSGRQRKRELVDGAGKRRRAANQPKSRFSGDRHQ